VGHRNGLEAVPKGKNPFLAPASNQTPDVQPIA